MAERARKNIWWAAMTPPLLWMAQGSIGWFIAAHACPSSTQPLSLKTARLLIALLTLGAIGVTVVALVAARRSALLPSDASKPAEAESAKAQRARFVAVLGLVVCITLTLGLCLAGLPSLVLGACGETR